MKKVLKKIEKGSIMIEALAMLALIALVTPLLYKKTSERMRELADINSAGEMRSIIKAVDDYVSSNYDTLVAGGTVTNTCPGTNSDGGNIKEQSYANLKNNHIISVPIGHFCEFLPYGILDNAGNPKVNKFFQDYKVILKLTGGTQEKDSKVITAFVVTDPRVAMPELRSSSIASMIGGNGGYVKSNTGDSGTEASTGSITGNLGLWGIEDTENELGITVKKGAIVAASIQGISSQNANIDIDDVLYRKPKQGRDLDLHTMSTTLYMGVASGDSFGHEIQNIGKLIVGSRTATNGNDRLYLASGNIRIGSGGGNIEIDGTGDIILNGTKNNINIKKEGNIVTKKGTFETSEGRFISSKSGALEITNSLDTAININSGLFTVAKTGVTKALNFQTNDGKVLLNVDDKTTIKEPVVVESTGGNCTFSNSAGCALTVKGGEYIDGNLIVTETFNAKNLHAREKLTVGGPGEDDANALSVEYKSGNKSTLKFGDGDGLLKVTESGSQYGSLDFAKALIEANKTSDTVAHFKVTVPNAANNEIGLRTGTSNVILKQNLAQISGSDTNYLQFDSTKSSQLSSYLVSPNFYINKDGNNAAFKLTGTDNAINTLVKKVTITPKSPTTAGGYLEVSDTAGTAGTVGSSPYGRVYAKLLNAYFVGNSKTDRSHVYQKNSEYHLLNESSTDILRLARSADNEAYADIYAQKVLYKANNNDTDKILEIDMKNTTTISDTSVTATRDNNNYPVYIRRGAIELTDKVNSDYENVNTNKNVYNYVKADRFVSNKKTMSGDLVKPSGDKNNPYNRLGALNYTVNPAYTSVMRDIKLTSRGGARLSDILPDFINKGIYVVDNTYPAKGESCGGNNNGTSLLEYQKGALTTGKGFKQYSDEGDTSHYVGQCNDTSQEVSPWLGFVPRPVCPPGYLGVITLTPTSFAMAQTGYAASSSEWMTGRTNRSSTKDIFPVENNIESPFDHMGEVPDENSPIPAYSQKNTWLKSDAVPFPSDGFDNDGRSKCSSAKNCTGWDLSMGFIYPLAWYDDYIKKATNNHPENLALDTQGRNDNERIIWNLFPVYAGTLEGYATVYCYFQRTNDSGAIWNEQTVDVGYNQIDNFRDPTIGGLPATGALKTNKSYMNDNTTNADYGDW